jgi:hypothetical protein
MEMPVDVLNKRLGNIRDNGDIDFDNTMTAIDIDEELQEKFLFFPFEEIRAVQIHDDGDGKFHIGDGPERCSARAHENPNWLYNHALHALAMWQHLLNIQSTTTAQEDSPVTPTPTTDTAQQEAEELQNLLALRSQLDERVKELKDRAEKRQYPDPPKIDYPNGDSFSVDLQYKAGGKVYRFVLLRVEGRWYSTGSERFETWKEVIDWLRGPDVYWHSAFYRLTNGGTYGLGSEYPNKERDIK